MGRRRRLASASGERDGRVPRTSYGGSMMAALRRDGTWDSALSVGGFAAIRSVGFEPAGQVFGAAVYYLSVTAGVSCPGIAARHLPRDMSPQGPGRSPATVPGQGIPGPAARIAQALHDAGGTDHFAEAVITGTAMARFA